MSSVAIMQPYFLPYLGYYQLIRAADRFVIFDDVNFIKRGYVNRNNLLLDGKPYMFTLPVKNASQNRLISEHEVFELDKFKVSFLSVIKAAYHSAPNYAAVRDLLADILDPGESSLTRLLERTLKKTCEFLGIQTPMSRSSELADDRTSKGEKRIIQITKAVGADQYINPIGGLELYHDAVFRENGIDLFFIKMGPNRYEQGTETFVPNLSILDVMMFNSPREADDLLAGYTLIKHT